MSSQPRCTSQHPSFFLTTNFKWLFFSWYMLILNILAVIFSGLCITILIKHPRVFGPSTRIWFLALITSDLFTILIAGSDMYAEIIFPTQYHEILGRIFGSLACGVRVSITIFLQWSSNLLQTGLSVERMMSVISPLRTRAYSTGRLTRITIFLLIAFSCAIALTVEFVTRKPIQLLNASDDRVSRVAYSEYVACIRYNVTEMFGENTTLSIDINQLVYYCDLILFRLVPFVVMFVTSATITGLIYTQRRRRDKLVSANSALLIRYRASSANRECRASLLLLAINITTLLTNPLFLLFELLDGEGSEGRPDAKLTGDYCVSWVLRHFFNALLYFNNQTNWIFYLTFGARFRVHIANMFLCVQSSTRNNDVSVVTSHMANQKSIISAASKQGVRKKVSRKKRLSNTLALNMEQAVTETEELRLSTLRCYEDIINSS